MNETKRWPIALLILMGSAAVPAAAQPRTDVEALPCNTLCHRWMGTTPESEAVPEQQVVQDLNEDSATKQSSPNPKAAKPKTVRFVNPPRRPVDLGQPGIGSPLDQTTGVELTATDQDARTLVLVTQPQITRISDLDAKVVGIDRALAVGAEVIKATLAKGGAPSARLMRSHRSDVDRLVGGDVQAIILAVLSQRSASGTIELPRIPGYNTLALPLASNAPSKEGP